MKSNARKKKKKTEAKKTYIFYFVPHNNSLRI